MSEELTEPKRFENEGHYEEIALKMAKLATTIISEFRDHQVYRNAGVLGSSLSTHVRRVAGCKANFNPVLRDRDFKFAIIALLDIAQQILNDDATAIADYYKQFKETAKKTEEHGAKGWGK